jgi:hypothetical protein
MRQGPPASASIDVMAGFFRSDRRGADFGTNVVGEVRDIPATGLGDDAVGLTFAVGPADEAAVVAYFWTMGNLSFHARGGGAAGTFDEAEILALARSMAARAG